MLTAGYDRALHVIVLAELLRRDGLEICGVVVVSPFQLNRFRQMVRQRGWNTIKTAAGKLRGQRSIGGAGGEESLLVQYARSEAVEHTSLKKWARDRGVPYHSVKSLNDPDCLRFLSGTNATAVIYGGGGILKKDFIEAVDGRVLNAHSGPLPAIRGMNACEWSLLRGLAPCVTIHFIDAGIDTGPVLEEAPVGRDPGDTVERLRDKCALLGVQRLRHHAKHLETPPPAPSAAAATLERQCFVLAPALREILDQRLASPSAERAGPC